MRNTIKYFVNFIYTMEVRIMTEKLTSHDWDEIRGKFTTDTILEILRKDLSNLQNVDPVDQVTRNEKNYVYYTYSTRYNKMQEFYDYANRGLLFVIGVYVFETDEEAKKNAFGILDTLFRSFQFAVNTHFRETKNTKKFAVYYEALCNLRAANWIDRLYKFAEDDRYSDFTSGGLLLQNRIAFDSTRVLDYFTNPEYASRFSNLEITELLLIASNITRLLNGLSKAYQLTEFHPDVIINTEISNQSRNIYNHILGTNDDGIERLDSYINVENPITTAFCLYLINSPDVQELLKMRCDIRFGAPAHLSKM